jgi:hypothetical protein
LKNLSRLHDAIDTATAFLANIVIAQGGVYWGIGIGNPWSVSLMASKARTARLRPVSTTDLMSA